MSIDEKALAAAQDRWAKTWHEYRDISVRTVIEYYEAARELVPDQPYAGGNTERHMSGAPASETPAPHQLGDAPNTAPPAPIQQPDECRAAFEIKAALNYTLDRRDDGHYEMHATEACWKGWQNCWDYLTKVKPTKRESVERIEIALGNEIRRAVRAGCSDDYLIGFRTAMNMILPKSNSIEENERRG